MPYVLYYTSYHSFKERTFSKNSCWQKPPTHIYPLEPSGSVHYSVESLPFLTKAIGLITETPAAYPQHIYNIVFNAYCGSHIPAMQFPFYSSAIFKKTHTRTHTHTHKTKRHTLLIFKSESFPPPNLCSPTDKSTMYTVSVITMLSFFLRFIPSEFFPPNCPCCNDLLLLFSLMTNTVKCPRAVLGLM